MVTPKLRLFAAGCAAAIYVVAAVGLSELFLDVEAATVVNDMAQLSAGIAAALVCWRTGRRLTGVERSWRLLIAAGMLGWSAGQLVWAYHRTVSGDPIPSPSLADVGYLTLPVFAFVAIVAFAVDSSVRQSAHPRVLAARMRFGAAIVLDGLIIVGSLFLATWATALGATVKANAATPLAFGVAIAYPLTDLILAAMVALLLMVYRIAHPYQLQMRLLGSGLIAIAVSDTLFAYAVSSEVESISPVNDAGFIAGPVLIALAGMATGGGTAKSHMPAAHRATSAQIVVPLLASAIAGAIILTKMALGKRLDSVEVALGLGIVCLFAVRQLIVIVDLAVKRVADHVVARSRESFRVAADKAVTAFEQGIRRTEPSLEEEIIDLSTTLSTAARRLQTISLQAQRYEDDVKRLVDQADAAKAIAKLHEDDASKIAKLLGYDAAERIRREVDKLAVEHNRQIELLRDSSRKVAVWTFLGGVTLGAIANIIVALAFR